jgi:hypothetical protein
LVRELEVPAGSYLIVATTRLENFTERTFFDSGTATVYCDLEAGGSQISSVNTLSAFLEGGSTENLALNLVHTFAAAGDIELVCHLGDVLDDVFALDANITAARVA